MIEKLAGSEVSQLIVVDQAEKPVGVISTDDLLHYLVSIHRQAVHPVQPNQTGSVRRGSLAASRLRQRREDSIGEELAKLDMKEKKKGAKGATPAGRKAVSPDKGMRGRMSCMCFLRISQTFRCTNCVCKQRLGQPF